MSVTPLAILSVGLCLLAGGAGWSDIPFIGCLAIPVALVGAVMVGSAAFAFKDPQGSAVRRGVGDVLLLIGTIALLLGCMSAVHDVQSHLLSAMRRIGKGGLSPGPDLRFLAGCRPAVHTLALWLGATGMLYLGVMLRQRVSTLDRSLLFLCWLASAPLAVLVLLFAYMIDAPLST